MDKILLTPGTLTTSYPIKLGMQHNYYHRRKLKRHFYVCILVILMLISKSSFGQKSTLQFIVCSDLHFGLTKPVFRNGLNVASSEVNAAMVAQMNVLPLNYLPIDDGVSSGDKIGAVEAVIITGDLCNRQEVEVQSATVSWKQFEEVYIKKLHLQTQNGGKTKLFLTPGNHDISNAIGFYKPMQPLMDNASMVGIYNLEMQPINPKSAISFDFQKDKIHYSVNMGGIHLMFVGVWPDSAERVWMQQDLKQVSPKTPVFIFTHSDPNPEARFFQNPTGDHSINPTDKFENLVEETFKDGVLVKEKTIIEQRGLVNFLQAHQNIKAYFHGHSNYMEFYDWTGPDSTISLPCFRVDSPMKGKISAKDETKLSFNVISIDPEKRLMTVRECFWNAHPNVPTQPFEWGNRRTISFNP